MIRARRYALMIAAALAAGCDGGGSLSPPAAAAPDGAGAASADAAADVTRYRRREPEPGPEPDPGVGAGPAGPPCERQGLEPETEHAEQVSGKATPYFAYLAYSSEATPYDVLIIESYQGDPFGGPAAPGTFDLSGMDYATCGLCVLAGAECEGMRCKRMFLATQGTLEVTAWGGVGGRFAGALHDAVLAEVTVDPQSYASTPRDGGERWCLDGYAFDQPVTRSGAIPPSHAAPECVPEGSGTGLGDNIADFALPNCLGELVPIHQSCGQKALWLVVVAAWCSACSEYVPKVAALWEEFHPSGLDVWFVLGEDAWGGQPDPVECLAWAEAHGVDPSLVVMDHDGEAAWRTLFDHLDPYATTIGLPWSAVLRGANLEYVYSQSVGGDLTAVLAELLSEP